MKKILALALTLAMVLSLAACGGDTASDTSGNAEERWDSELKGQLENYIVMELNRVFEQCKLLNSDAMRFGRYACMQFSSVEAWRDYAWKEKYKNMTAEFGVTVKLNDRIISSHIE